VLAFGEHARAPMVTTIHGFSGAGILPAYTRSRSAFVAISDSDRYAGLDYAATIHHGIDLALLPYRAAGGDDLVSFGRIHPDKGTADAIEIARRAGRRLVICGIFLGSVGPQRRAEILGGAAALLHPIYFDEPFGLSVVEAMACGTPVVAYRRGSMPEVIDEGVTGYLAHDISSAVHAVRAAAQLDRAVVHARAVARFGVDRMVEDYLRTYETLLMSASTSSSGA
jgi:glycosyltransferase involved in cell wall biosynthesis